MTDDLMFLLFVLCFGLASGIAIGHSTTSSIYKKQAISHGYALYCPIDGKFAWQGECVND